ncbi:lysosomal-associated transmembrane protein 4A-like [Oppia nitens]|uniref:lysosomal-associated transmembrane protein 4A-like n=1 Tax=Oppia nitens TaxID=1686743 RepID=UPI0023DB63E1|nr:lysosomal-associated transmembrane protein 4A-like [Oppia nitens]
MDDSMASIERHAYCLCLHVRPATIFVALVNLGGSLICGIVTIALLSYSDSAYIQSLSDSNRSASASLAIVVYMLLSMVSAMLLYGVIKSRPTYILPFFGIQFIDFLFTLPQFLTSLYAHPNGNHYQNWVDRRTSNTFLDMRHLWPNASSNNVYTSSLLLMTLIVLFKSYFLCVVWKCYRYLRMKELVLPLHLPHFNHNITQDMAIPSIMVPPPHMAPPDYDEATKSCAPPDYETATKSSEFKFVPDSGISQQTSSPTPESQSTATAHQSDQSTTQTPNNALPKPNDV